MALSGSVGSYQEFGYTGGMQQVTIPSDGIYKLEVWGAEGGPVNETRGGDGGYSVGYKNFTKGTVIYICVGGGGLANLGKGYLAGGYNGGGGALCNNSSCSASSGGGATHMASVSGTLASIGASNISKIHLVAGGGGGGAYYNENNASNGGAGGGWNGSGSSAGGGSQTAGGGGWNNGQNGSFGQGGYSEGMGAAGGGGGLYGGGAAIRTNSNCGAGGGSGYIGGVPSFTYNGITYSPSTSNGQRRGNGYAKITLAALTKIYKLNVDESVVQTVYLDGVALEQIKFDDVSVFGNP